MTTKNVIIDCDTGVDDAIALLIGLQSKALNVLGITCVGGNVPLDNVVRNTLVVVEHSRAHVPVFRGCAQPLLVPLQTAKYAHGSDGLGDIGFPDPQLTEQTEHAVDFIVRTGMDFPEPVDLITLAPLTNIALALVREPRLQEKIRSLTMMAGGIGFGNSTAFAEFNVWVDPEAADIVFRSHIPKTMIALDPINQYSKIDASVIERIERGSAPWCKMAGALLRHGLERWKGPVSPPDAAAMAVAIEPSTATSKEYPVMVETRGQYTRGMTVVDRRRWRGESTAAQPNVHVVETIDTSRYHQFVLDTLLGAH